MIQGSDLWHQERSKRLGCSEVSAVMGSSWLSSRNVTTLWKEKVGLGCPFVMNENVSFGMDQEESARKFFEKVKGIKMTPQVYVHDDYPFLGASLDGISDDSTVLEIKVPTDKTFSKVATNYIAPYYYTQLQAAMFSSASRNSYYWVYRPDRGALCFSVPICDEYCEEMVKRARKFWDYLENRICPVSADFNIDDSKVMDPFTCDGMEHKFEGLYPILKEGDF